MKLAKSKILWISAAAITFLVAGAKANSGRTLVAKSGRASGLGSLETPIISLGQIAGVGESLQQGGNSPLEKLIDENDCDRKIVLPEEQPPLEAGDVKIARVSVEVSGAGCPVTYKMYLDGVQEPMGFKAEFSMVYEARSTEAKALYDVDAADFKGELSAVGHQTPTGGGITFDFKYSGQGHSQSQGAFTSLSQLHGSLSVSAPQGGPLNISGGFDDLMKFDFKNESAELKSKIILSGFSPSAEYLVNGQQVDEKEYRSIRDLVKLPGMDGIGLGNEEPPAQNLECKAEVFRGANLTPASSVRSCGGFFTDQKDVDGIKTTTRFTAEPTHTSVRVEMCPAGAACGVVERAFLPDETMTYVDEILTGYKVVTTCSVVTACVP